MTEQKAGLLGSTALIPATGRYLHNQRLGPVTELNEAELDRYFLYHVLNSQPVRQQISVTAGGTKVRHSSPDKILAVSFWWVPLTEQKKIAAILSVWDQAIELTERLIAAKQQRKAALMQHLLTGNVRLPGFRHMHWRACELGDVASNSARRIGGDTPPPVYSVTNSIGMVPMDESVVGESIDRYKAVAKFDFAYNPMRINVGSIAMWYGDDEVLVSPDYVVFQCGQELDAEYLNHFRKTHYWHQFVNRSGGGSVRVRIYFSDLAELSLNLPPLDEQKAIAAVLNTQDREIELLQQKLDALRRQKKGLMQQLLTGKVRVNP
jgi:type I restriction enzyme S subunit